MEAILGVMALLLAGAGGFFVYRSRQHRKEHPESVDASNSLPAMVAAVGQSVSQSVGQANSKPAMPSKPGGKRHWLLGKEGSVAGKNFHIGERVATIGRAPTNFVQIKDENASRIQTRLSAGDHGLVIEDMESSNGTYVNDQRLGAKRSLRDGDTIRIGSDVFEYRAYGNFGVNHGLQRKQAGKGAIKATELNEESFESVVMRTLQETNNDVALAAQILDVDVELLRAFMDRSGIKPGR